MTAEAQEGLLEKVKCFLTMKGQINRSGATVVKQRLILPTEITAASVCSQPVCVWAYGRVFVWLSRGLYYNTSQAAERCNRRGSALFSSFSFFLDFVKLNPSKFLDENKWKAADLRVMLKSHNKVIIQSKHWSCTDSRAAVHGCKLIMNPDSPVLELMMHLFKQFTCFCWAVTGRKNVTVFMV